MLRNLLISNYALIEHLDLEFGPGLTIVTGETGAGKSIMLGALSLVMGGRADTKVIADGNSKSVVQAVFTDVDPYLRSLFEQKGIEWIVDEDGVAELSIRRELSASGRSKIFVNDSVVTLQTLSLIAPRLIDIHSQHANAKINDASERLNIIDSLAGNKDLREDYKAVFDEYADLRRRIALRKNEMERAEQNVDFMRFQLDQLSRLNPKRGELAEIEKRFEMLSDADEVKERLSNLASLIDDSERGAAGLVASAVSLAERIGVPAPSSRPIPERLRDILVELKDIYETVEDFNTSVDTDPATLAALSARMNLYYELVKRFKVKDADDLALLFEDVKQKVKEVTLGDDILPEMERELRQLAHALKQRAEILTLSRKKAAREFSKKLCEIARPLGLHNINFVAEVKPKKLASAGADEIDFLCSFNKNGVPKPIGDIASGGEISRMMLSLKAILAGHINLPTIIFDEVDTGVSGEIADKMGAMMKEISRDMQVIVITHLPQVAAKGDHHFKVYKQDAEQKTVTHVRPLTVDERIRELAAMISGSAVTDAALSAARDLLKL